jgi:hypothetical protein
VRAYRGLIAAVLLAALAFLGGLDVLDTPPAQAATVAAEYGEGRDHDRRDFSQPQHAVVDHGAPDRRWVPALPPSPSHSHVPGSLRFAARATLPEAPSMRAMSDQRARHVAPCSPESLQTFRC